MKFGKITTANVSHNALSVGSALAGGALSGGLMSLVPQEQEVLARGGMTAVGLLGAASVKGKSNVDTLVKFALLGIGIRQGSELIKKFAAPAITIDSTSTASEKFVGGMVGLACPDNTASALAVPAITFPALRNPGRPVQPIARVQETNEVPVGAF